MTRNIGDGHIFMTADEVGSGMLPYSVFECMKSIQCEPGLQNEAQGFNQLVHILTMMTSALKDDNKSAILCCQFLSKLILKAVHSNVPKILLLRGYMRMLKHTAECMCNGSSPFSLQFRWSDPADVVAIIQSRLSSHPVTHWQANSSMQDLILSLFMENMQETLREEQSLHTKPDSPAIVFKTVVGPIQKSTMLSTTLLMDIPLTREMNRLLERKRNRGLVVALFECSLELSGGNNKQIIELSMESANHGLQASTEHIMLSEFAQMLARSHVQVVCCQKRVHPHLVRQLKELNILCISRVSVKYMGALVRLSGARQLSTMPIIGLKDTCNDVLDPSSLGYLHKVELVHLYGKPFLLAEGFKYTEKPVESTSDESTLNVNSLQGYLLNLFPHLPVAFTAPYAASVAQRQRNCVTVVVAAPTEITATMWQRAIEDVLTYLRHLSNGRAVVLPGSGIWQAMLARELRASHVANEPPQQLSRLHRQTRDAERLYIECVEECAVAAGGARTQRRQLSTDGEGWDQQQLLAQFTLGRGETASTSQTVLRSPDGAEVSVVQEPRCSADSNHANANSTYRLDTTGTSATPPLDSLTGCLSALQIATEATCALLDVDGIYSVAATAV